MAALRILVLMACVAAAQTSYSVQGATQLAAAKNWSGLLEYAKAWTAAQPANAAAWYQLGNAYAFGPQDYRGASAAYEHAVALNAQWAEGWHSLGCSYALGGEMAKAIPAFQHAADAGPHTPAYWNHLQAAYRQAGDAARALEVLTRGVEASGPYARADDWYAFANAYAALGQQAHAIELYNKAITMNKRFAAAYNNRGSAEQAAGLWREALADYRHAGDLGDSLAPANGVNLQIDMDKLHHEQQLFPRAGDVVMGKLPQYPKGHTGAAHVEASFAMTPASAR